MLAGLQKYTPCLAALFALGLTGCSDQQAQKLGDATAESAKSANRALSIAAEKLGNAASRIKQQVGEAELTGKVYARLHWDKQLQSVQVSIDSQQGGIVVLSGTVESAELRDRIVDIAANTMGVREVHDRMQIVRSEKSTSRDRTTGRDE